MLLFRMMSAGKFADKRLFEHACLIRLSRGKAAAIEVRPNMSSSDRLFVLLPTAEQSCICQNFLEIKKMDIGIVYVFFDQAPKEEVCIFEL